MSWRRARSQRPTCTEVPEPERKQKHMFVFVLHNSHTLGPQPGSMHIATTAYAACISQAALRKPLLLLTCLQSAAASP